MLQSGLGRVVPLPRLRLGAAAFLTMLGAVAFSSLVPLIVAAGGAADSPFWFMVAWRAGLLAGTLGVLFLLFGDLLASRAVWSVLWRRGRHWMVLAMLPVGLDYSLLIWASSLLDVAVVVIIIELWPVCFMVMGTFLLVGVASRFQRRRRLRSLLTLLPFAVVGMALAVSSQEGSLPLVGGAGRGGSPVSWSTLAGAGLALLAAVCIPMVAFAIRWSWGTAVELPRTPVGGRSLAILALFGCLLCQVVVSSVILVSHLGLALVLEDFSAALLPSALGVGSGAVLLWSLAGGLISHFPQDVLFKFANVVGTNIGVNALMYLAGPLSLVWLAWAGFIGVARPDYLVMGVAFILLANFFINLELAGRASLRVAALCLSVLGGFVYLAGSP